MNRIIHAGDPANDRRIIDPNEVSVQLTHNMKTGEAILAVNPMLPALPVAQLLLSAAQQLLNGAISQDQQPQGLPNGAKKITTS